MDKTLPDDLQRKIQKLIALGDSPSEAEAASALAKAQVLLARHGLSLDDLPDPVAAVQEVPVLAKRRFRKWEQYLFSVVGLAAFCQPFHRSGADGVSQLVYIGRTQNIDAAVALFGYLYRVVLLGGRTWGKQVAHVDSFRLGMVHRLGERLENPGDDAVGGETREQGGDVVVAMKRTTDRENQAYMEEKYGRTRNRSLGLRVDSGSFDRGRQVADRVSLDPRAPVIGTTRAAGRQR